MVPSFVHDGARDAVLREIALRREQHRCAVIHGVPLSRGGIGLRHGIGQCRLSRLIADNAQRAGRIVVGKVDIHLVAVAGGQQAARLRAALGVGRVRNAPRRQIDDGDVVPIVHL